MHDIFVSGTFGRIPINQLELALNQTWFEKNRPLLGGIRWRLKITGWDTGYITINGTQVVRFKYVVVIPGNPVLERQLMQPSDANLAAALTEIGFGFPDDREVYGSEYQMMHTIKGTFVTLRNSAERIADAWSRIYRGRGQSVRVYAVGLDSSHDWDGLEATKVTYYLAVDGVMVHPSEITEIDYVRVQEALFNPQATSADEKLFPIRGRYSKDTINITAFRTAMGEAWEMANNGTISLEAIVWFKAVIIH